MRLDGCPNCGRRLVTLREEHQHAGSRRIWLRWLQCSECGHVALEDWSFIDEVQRDRAKVTEMGSHRKQDETTG